MTTTDLIRAWTAANERARADYYANTPEAQRARKRAYDMKRRAERKQP
jgi:hypothetical protein